MFSRTRQSAVAVAPRLAGGSEQQAKSRRAQALKVCFNRPRPRSQRTVANQQANLHHPSLFATVLAPPPQLNSISTAGLEGLLKVCAHFVGELAQDPSSGQEGEGGVSSLPGPGSCKVINSSPVGMMNPRETVFHPLIRASGPSPPSAHHSTARDRREKLVESRGRPRGGGMMNLLVSSKYF